MSNLGIKIWVLAKFRNKNVNFRAKNNGHQNFTKSLGIPEPLPPCLGNIPKIYQFFRLSASPTQPVDRKRLRFLISFLQNQQLAWLLHHEEHWLCAHWWSGKGFAQVVIITIFRQTNINSIKIHVVIVVIAIPACPRCWESSIMQTFSSSGSAVPW